MAIVAVRYSIWICFPGEIQRNKVQTHRSKHKTIDIESKPAQSTTIIPHSWINLKVAILMNLFIHFQMTFKGGDW